MYVWDIEGLNETAVVALKINQSKPHGANNRYLQVKYNHAFIKKNIFIYA